MRASFIVPAFVAVLALTLAACGASPTASPTATATAPATATATAPPTSAPPATEPAGGTAVSMADFSFAPADVTVAVGTTVTWTNRGPSAHTATADDGSFDSGGMDTGDTFLHTFDTAGTFSYICSFHPQMTGTVTVQ